MHVHLPKPLHGWREFAGEVGIIVFGVLIALGAEQAIEAIHWHRQVSEFRQTVDAELGDDWAAYQYRIQQEPCVKRRIGEVQQWLAAHGGQSLIGFLTDGIDGAVPHPQVDDPDAERPPRVSATITRPPIRSAASRTPAGSASPKATPPTRAL